MQSGLTKERVFSFANNSQAATLLKELLTDGDAVLVKGSRGMKMEQIVHSLADANHPVDSSH
jgi:UDP-N-acetylmuramoyl-tripeptide--D-alanyl-D-alanine ligase